MAVTGQTPFAKIAGCPWPERSPNPVAEFAKQPPIYWTSSSLSNQSSRSGSFSRHNAPVMIVTLLLACVLGAAWMMQPAEYDASAATHYLDLPHLRQQKQRAHAPQRGQETAIKCHIMQSRDASHGSSSAVTDTTICSQQSTAGVRQHITIWQGKHSTSIASRAGAPSSSHASSGYGLLENSEYGRRRSVHRKVLRFAA